MSIIEIRELKQMRQPMVILFCPFNSEESINDLS